MQEGVCFRNIHLLFCLNISGVLLGNNFIRLEQLQKLSCYLLNMKLLVVLQGNKNVLGFCRPMSEDLRVSGPKPQALLARESDYWAR